MTPEEHNAKFGIVFNAKDTAKLLELCEYMDITPYEFFVRAIDRIWHVYQDQVQLKNEKM